MMTTIERARKQMREMRLSMAGIPPELRGDRVADMVRRPEIVPMIHTARSYVSSGMAGGLYLSGPSGVGKTHIARALAIAAIDADRWPVRFWVWTDYLAAVNESYDGTRVHPGADARTAEVLVLDDLGTERATERNVTELFNIVNHRTDRRMTTIYTSNFSLALLRERVDCPQIGGAKITRRIHDACGRHIRHIDNGVEPYDAETHGGAGIRVDGA